MKGVVRQLPSNIPSDPHFVPWYNPWEQRVCISRSGDFFQALKSGNADVVTAKISTVTKTGLEVLPVGSTTPQVIDTDILVTATGLKIKIAGGASVTIDGQLQDISKLYLWKGVMLQNFPNLGYVIGYAAASWTLGADASAFHICRILKYTRENGLTSVVPRKDGEVREIPVMPISSTYMEKGKSLMPRCGATAPWQPRDNYLYDIWEARRGNSEGLEFV